MKKNATKTTNIVGTGRINMKKSVYTGETINMEKNALVVAGTTANAIITNMKIMDLVDADAIMITARR